MHPVAREVATGGDGLGPLVRVVREDEVVAATVQVESVAEDAQAHGHTLDVPARPSLAPRGVPGRLARLGRLPQREVERVLLGLVDLDPGAGPLPQVVEAPVDELAVAGHVLHPQIHAGVGDVGGAAVDQRLHEVDHLVDERRGVGPVVGVEDVEVVHRLDVDGLPVAGDLGLGRSLLVGPVDDVVVDVGDVGDVVHVDPRPLEIAADDVVGEGLAGVTQVGVVVDRGAAGVERDPAFVARLEWPDAAGEGVVQTHHGGSGLTRRGRRVGRGRRRTGRRAHATR